MYKSTQRQKHDYTSEMELKSLLIRIKNKRTKKNFSEKYNSKINKYVKWYEALAPVKYKSLVSKEKKAKLKKGLKNKIISLSEITNIDDKSYEVFGKVILLMIKNILKKPNFSGYTYVDDFYSDAVHKIIKYLHNFDHTKISKSTNVSVNSFAYISQIIHNSIIFIINSKKKEIINVKKLINNTINDEQIDIKDYDTNNLSTHEKIIIEQNIVIEEIKTSLYHELVLLKDVVNFKDGIINVTYPKMYRISFEEYDKIKELTEHSSGNFNIIRNKKVAK